MLRPAHYWIVGPRLSGLAGVYSLGDGLRRRAGSEHRAWNHDQCLRQARENAACHDYPGHYSVGRIHSVVALGGAARRHYGLGVSRRCLSHLEFVFNSENPNI